MSKTPFAREIIGSLDPSGPPHFMHRPQLPDHTAEAANRSGWADAAPSWTRPAMRAHMKELPASTMSATEMGSALHFDSPPPSDDDWSCCSSTGPAGGWLSRLSPDAFWGCLFTDAVAVRLRGEGRAASDNSNNKRDGGKAHQGGRQDHPVEAADHHRTRHTGGENRQVECDAEH